MSDGQTSLLRVYDAGDMPMLDLLLNANLQNNYSDRDGFMYHMAVLYQGKDRGWFFFIILYFTVAYFTVAYTDKYRQKQ